MDRPRMFAAIAYRNSSNLEEKIETFMDGYKYAHKEMEEEIKKFTQGFAYKKKKARANQWNDYQ